MKSAFTVSTVAQQERSMSCIARKQQSRKVALQYILNIQCKYIVHFKYTKIKSLKQCKGTQSKFSYTRASFVQIFLYFAYTDIFSCLFFYFFSNSTFYNILILSSSAFTQSLLLTTIQFIKWAPQWKTKTQNKRYTGLWLMMKVPSASIIILSEVI